MINLKILPSFSFKKKTTKNCSAGIKQTSSPKDNPTIGFKKYPLAELLNFSDPHNFEGKFHFSVEMEPLNLSFAFPYFFRSSFLFLSWRASPSHLVFSFSWIDVFKRHGGGQQA